MAATGFVLSAWFASLIGFPMGTSAGLLAGAMTSGAALSVVNSAARSSVPALGYTGAYAFANVNLTVAGTLIVLL